MAKSFQWIYVDFTPTGFTNPCNETNNWVKWARLCNNFLEYIVVVLFLSSDRNYMLWGLSPFENGEKFTINTKNVSHKTYKQIQLCISSYYTISMNFSLSIIFRFDARTLGTLLALLLSSNRNGQEAICFDKRV